MAIDGEVLHQLSSEHKIQVSVKQNPLSLDLQGVRISVEKFHEIIRALRKVRRTHMLSRSSASLTYI